MELANSKIDDDDTDIQKFKNSKPLRIIVVRYALNDIIKKFNVKVGIKDKKIFFVKKKLDISYKTPLYEKDFLQDISSLFIFLNKVGMHLLSSVIFLVVCENIKELPDSNFKKEILKKLNTWKSTQNYIKKIVPSKITGLKFYNNSCYQDSVIMCLFAVPNKFITNKILEKKLYVGDSPFLSCDKKNRDKDLEIRTAVQKELNNITNYIRYRSDEKPKNCSSLRNIIKRCQSHYHTFWSGNQQDASEFLTFLFSIFQLETRKIEIIKTKKTGDSWEKYETDTEKRSPIITISYNDMEKYIKKNLEINLKNFLVTSNIFQLIEGDLLKKKEKIIKSEKYIVFTVQRLYWVYITEKRGNTRPVVKLYNKKITIPEFIDVTKHKLQVSAIVMHEGSEKGGHYTCLFKVEDEWFFYDDVPSVIRKVGTFKEMIESKYEPEKRGTIFFYT